MFESLTALQLARLQFAITASYHFLFVPLTLGLSLLLAIMESVYVMTGKTIYKDMTRFWGKLFGINFALGVTTGITLEFQFGTNWAYYSHYVGDIFGAPLAIEGLMAFFLESTFIGLMVFGWDRMTKAQHLIVTYAVALGSTFSALWIVVANSFMQHPQGADFNPITMRMELQNFGALFFNSDAQPKFVHTVLAGYVTAAIFVCGISAWYMLKGRHLDLARRSFRVAAVFGMLGGAGVITLGDALGYVGARVQPTKLAAMEALWTAEKAPMAFNAIAFPNQAEQKNYFTIQIPAMLSILVTHSLDGVVPAIDQLEVQAQERIRNGIPAVQAMQKLSANPRDEAALAQFKAHGKDVGYGFLVLRYAPGGDLSKITDADIARAARSGSDPLATEAVCVFTGMLGSTAGSLALTLGARGGVYIAGGIIRQWGPLFDRKLFRHRFEAKGRLRAYLEPIPCHLVTAEDLAFRGLTAQLDQLR